MVSNLHLHLSRNDDAVSIYPFHSEHAYVHAAASSCVPSAPLGANHLHITTMGGDFFPTKPFQASHNFSFIFSWQGLMGF